MSASRFQPRSITRQCAALKIRATPTTATYPAARPTSATAAGSRATSDADARLRLLQSRRHLLVLALELQSGTDRHRLKQRCKIGGQILLGIGLELRCSEMLLQHFARGSRDRHRHAHLGAEAETQV